MNTKESVALFAQGKDAWNAWAAERQAEREALKAAGTWVESPREHDWNDETRAWHDTAKADFSNHNFEEAADFSDFLFPGDARFERASFASGAGFGGASFAGIAGFDQTLFKGYTTFQDAVFQQSPNFMALRGERAFSFARTKFFAVPDFEQAHFEEAPRLDNLSIEPGGFWRRILVGVKSTRKDLPAGMTAPARGKALAWSSWQALRAEFLALRRRRFRGDTDLAARWRALKRLAIQAHDHARELDFFRGEIKAARWAKGNFWPTVFSYPYQLFSGFGGAILRPFIWWAVSVALFTCLYLGTHLEKPHPKFSGIEWMTVSLTDWARFEVLSSGLLENLPMVSGDMPALSCIAGPDDKPW